MLRLGVSAPIHSLTFSRDRAAAARDEVRLGGLGSGARSITTEGPGEFLK